MTGTTESGDSGHPVKRQPATASANNNAPAPASSSSSSGHSSGNRAVRVIRNRFDHFPVESKNFLPYQYQTMLYEIAKDKNTIICMSTGTGKTFIAIMLLKEMSHQIRSEVPFCPDPGSGQREVFSWSRPDHWCISMQKVSGI